MVLSFISVACGGALGASLRYGVNILAPLVFGHGFPYATMIVNVLGSFVMGVLVAIFAHFWSPPETIKIFIMTGMLGAFTTFSTFSLDFITLWERADLLQAGLYLGASVFLSILALFFGLFIVRHIAI